jgi:hypothetical protein
VFYAFVSLADFLFAEIGGVPSLCRGIAVVHEPHICRLVVAESCRFE